jgi:hypothetical protein
MSGRKQIGNYVLVTNEGQQLSVGPCPWMGYLAILELRDNTLIMP